MNTPLGIRIAIWLWFFAALAAGTFRVWQRAPAVVLPVTLLALTACLVLAHGLIPSFRRWIDQTGVRTLVLLHATRFVTFYFFVLYQRGDLPAQIALPAGLGGCTVAALAVVVALVRMPETFRLRAIAIWNMVGLADLVLVGYALVQLELGTPGLLLPLTHLPLSLLPTFLYPLILASHLAVFAKLARAPR